VTWHDGKPFTSADVVFSADVFLRKTHARLRNNLAAVESIRALDPLTVEFKLKYPFGPFLGIFETGTMPMVPKHIYEGTDFADQPGECDPDRHRPVQVQGMGQGQLHPAGGQRQATTSRTCRWSTACTSTSFPMRRRAQPPSSRARSTWCPGGAVEYFDVLRCPSCPARQVTTKGWEFFAPHSWLWMNNRKSPMDNIKFRQA
jgi:peptide/nickel transport system substrate-binding protein